MNNVATTDIEDIEAISRIPAVATMLEVICRTTGLGFSAIARVTENRWIACAVNDKIQFGLLPGGELNVETTICNEIRQSREAVVIDHVAADEVYYCHHTPAMYGFQSYISVPIILKDGSFFGTLCAIDPKPAKLNSVLIREMFSLFADLIAFHLSALKEVDDVKSHLSEEREVAELREQFVAILGHDLRNPVGAILNSALLLLRSDLGNRDRQLSQIIVDCSYRMKELIDNIMDFAKGRLGSGIQVNRTADLLRDELLFQIISEVKAIHPERVIYTNFEIDEPVPCDSKRIAQLFSNLLSNAITHGKKDSPIRVVAATENGQLTLSVINEGNKIPDEVRKRLFQPFVRGEGKGHQDGLGLGLYISSEIAKAHGGNLSVFSSDTETRFTLVLKND